jgi:hypothetical protein
MSREHFWPLWLINHAEVHFEGVRWESGPNANPRSATLPICAECNHRLGSELEEPVSRILPSIEAGNGVSDCEAELLVRWLWKFEGISSSFAHLDDDRWRYSGRWPLIDRVLGDSLVGIRPRLTLAMGLTNSNDDGYDDWPMGLDHGGSILDAIFVSGVFRKTALMVSLSDFEHLIPGCFGLYRLNAVPLPEGGVRFHPPVCFPRSLDAINVTKAASRELKLAHERWAAEQQERQQIQPIRPRLEIPNL